MKYLIILFSALLLTACKKEKETVSESPKPDSAQIVQDSAQTDIQTKEIAVDIIPFPKEIKECSCYFAKNKTDFENEKYIYADDAGKTAYMKLDGVRQALNLISSSDMEADDILSKEIETDQYKISVKGRKLPNEEALLFEGTLTIEKPDGTRTFTPIYGECGC